MQFFQFTFGHVLPRFSQVVPRLLTLQPRFATFRNEGKRGCQNMTLRLGGITAATHGVIVFGMDVNAYAMLLSVLDMYRCE